MMPTIVKETNTGYSRLSITDQMFSNRKILCVGPINPDSVNELILQLMHLEAEDPNQPIKLYINSPGGETSSGLALYDVMQAISCPIHTICIGMAASMGAVLFAAGDERYMLPHSRVMIHDPLSYNAGGSALAVKMISDNLMKTREVLAEILAKHTGHTMEEIYSKTSSDCYFHANEAIEFGLADHILEKLSE